MRESHPLPPQPPSQRAHDTLLLPGGPPGLLLATLPPGPALPLPCRPSLPAHLVQHSQPLTCPFSLPPPGPLQGTSLALDVISWALRETQGDSTTWGLQPQPRSHRRLFSQPPPSSTPSTLPRPPGLPQLPRARCPLADSWLLPSPLSWRSILFYSRSCTHYIFLSGLSVAQLKLASYPRYDVGPWPLPAQLSRHPCCQDLPFPLEMARLASACGSVLNCSVLPLLTDIILFKNTPALE